MDDVLVKKLQKWMNWRDEHRDEFIALSKQYADITDKIYEIRYRVPNDGDEHNQWDGMNKEGLQENLKYYNALLESLQVSVDTEPQYDADGNYIPWKKSDGAIDHDKYLDLLYKEANGYGGYYTYYEIMTYIIPNIQIAINNLNIPEDQKKDYIEDYETDWKLYGTVELEGKKKSCEEQLEVLKDYAKAWDDLTPEEKAQHAAGKDGYNSAGHDEYVKILGYLGSETTEGSLLYFLKKLNDEISELENQRTDGETERTSMANQAKWTHSSYGITDAEFKILYPLLKSTDYSNTNILTTSIDTTLTKIDVEKELYEDALDKVSELCQPQYKFTVSLDNLLRLDEFKEWVDELQLLHYIRLGTRDDYSVKLRVTGLMWNPCEVTPDLTLTFSNMVTSRSGRSDLTDLLQTENNRASKSSITYGTGNSDDEKQYLTTLLQLMVKNNLFKSSVENIAGNVTGGINQTEFNALFAKYIKATEIDVGKITGDEGSFKKFFTDYLDANYIAADTIIGNSAKFNELNTDYADVKRALLGTSSTVTGIVFNFTAENATIDAACIKDLKALQISVADLYAHKETAEQIVLISSEDGSPTIAFQNSTQQFFDKDGNIRVQIGQDAAGDFNFIVRGKDGKTALFNENGITPNAVSDGLIVNNMIADNTVGKEKLGFKIVEPNEQGGVDITQIYDGKGGLWGVEYNSFKEETTKSLENLGQKIDETASYTLYIEMPNGGRMIPSGIQLKARLFKNSVDVTDEWSDDYFTWTRQSADTYGDLYWNEQHTAGMKVLSLTGNDIEKDANFQCKFETDNITVLSIN